MSPRRLATLLLAACGGAPAAPTHPPPREVLALVVHVSQSGSDDTFCPALEAGLGRSGIVISNDAAQPADATLTCRMFASADTGWLQITSNGESRMRFTVRVEVRSSRNVLVDQFIAEYTGFKSSGADEDAVSKVVVGFAYSQRIAAFARVAKLAASTPVVATTDAQPAPTVTIETRDMKDPRDDVAWQKANHADCARKRSSDACVGVEAYDMQFPSGVHSEEARRLLKAAQK